MKRELLTRYNVQCCEILAKSFSFLFRKASGFWLVMHQKLITEQLLQILPFLRQMQAAVTFHFI